MKLFKQVILFDPCDNDDIQEALQVIYDNDKNAIQDFLNKIQDVENNVASSLATLSTRAIRHNQNGDPYFELVQELTKVKESNSNLKQQLRKKDEDYNNLEEKYNRLSSDIDEKIHEILGLKTDIEKLREEKETIEGLAQEAEKTANDLKVTLKNYKEGAEKKHKDQIREMDNLLRNKEEELNKKHYEETKQLQNEIIDIRKKLEKYEVPTGTTGDTKYFDINDNRLSDTLSDDVPYVGEVLLDGKISYQFNIDKGKVQEAIQNRETILEPFCEIVSSIEEGNAIQLAGRGLLRENGGTYDIIKKAKIKIVLQ